MKDLLTNAQMNWVNETWAKVETKMSVVFPRSKDKIPQWSMDGKHNDLKDENIFCWTNGFWPGLLWLMYSATGEMQYREAAERIEGYLDKALWYHAGLSHDVGFMWRISSGANYQLTGSAEAKNRQSHAADHLMSRYNLIGEYLRAWNGEAMGENSAGLTIIDTMLNLSILYWASEEYGDPRFKSVAMKHADNTMVNHIRPDGSVRHVVKHNPVTGEIVGEMAGQGYAVGSAWSRGQAWAVYGFVLSYIHTGKQEYLDTAKRAAHYFISCVCGDWLPRQDFRAPEEGIFDASAGLAAACGMIEIAKVVPEHEKKTYIYAAMQLLMTIEKEWADWSENTDFMIRMSTGKYIDKSSHNKYIMYADYYFVEALYKLKGFGPLFW